MRVKVLFDYAAENDDELTINPGDIIENVDKLDDNGWWEGDFNGKRGVFPDNFVEELPDDAPPAHKPGPPKPPPPKAHPPPQKKRLAKAVFDYEPENEDELALAPGDIITVIGEDVEGWWKGEKNGAVGVFPSNFVEEIDPSEADGASKLSAPPPSSGMRPRASFRKSTASMSSHHGTAPPPPSSDGGASESGEEHEPKDESGEPAIKAKKVQGMGFGDIFKGGMPALKKTKAKPPAPAGAEKKEDKQPAPMKPPPVKHHPAPPPPGHESKPEGHPAPLPPHHAAKPAPEPNLYKALYDFEAEEPEDLPLAIGDLVNVTGEAGEGWLTGEKDGRTGNFPDNFVEKAGPEDLAQWKEAHGAGAPPAAKEPAKPPPPAAHPPPPSGDKPPVPAHVKQDAAPAPPRKESVSRPAPPVKDSVSQPPPAHRPSASKPAAPSGDDKPAAPAHAPPSDAKPPAPKKAIKPPPGARPKPGAKPPPPKPGAKPAETEKEDATPPWKRELETRKKSVSAKPPAPATKAAAGSVGAKPPPPSQDLSAKPAAPATDAEATPSSSSVQVSMAEFTALKDKFEQMSGTIESLKKHVKILTEDLAKESAERAKMQFELERIKKLNDLA